MCCFSLFVSNNVFIWPPILLAYELAPWLLPFERHVFKRWVIEAFVISSHPCSLSSSIRGERCTFRSWYSSSPYLNLNLISNKIISMQQDNLLDTSFICPFNSSREVAVSIIWLYVWLRRKSRLLRGEGFLSLNLLSILFWIILNW